MKESIVLSDGKYTVILDSGNSKFLFYALRYNEPWEAGTHLDNLHLAMFQRIRDLEDRVISLVSEIQ
ncbi:MAG: hypothetical protein A2Y34_03900 [Spirochaetes bacterium GWC1_27_15]|nr:MAG: hypothetical protein A2Y34_03900 [Spirochaetes bacterium GWC1_27_15]